MSRKKLILSIMLVIGAFLALILCANLIPYYFPKPAPVVSVITTIITLLFVAWPISKNVKK